jgi:hypothetical protein
MAVNHLRLSLSLGAALLVAGFVACGTAPSGSRGTPRVPLATPSPVGLETPAAGSIYLGAFVRLTQGTPDITPLETSIGRTFAIDGHYPSWLTTFPGFPENGDLASGRLSLESWNCQPTNAQIVSGAVDALIQTRAIALKTFGHPVFLRYLWDMNVPAGTLNRGSCYDPSTDNADGTFSATEFVAAWKHMRGIFASEKVTNVIWVWSPSSTGVDPMPYYPGASQVDWVAFDAYDPSGVGFVPTVSAIYPTLAALGKPLLIAESGALAANQAAFLQQAQAALPTQFPLVKGFMYYDAFTTTTDWRLGQAGISALTTLGAQPYVSATGAL